MVQSETTIRVRFAETDRMGLLHHANYLTYFEVGRADVLHRQGWTYQGMEAQGMRLLLTHIDVRYRKPAWYDDELLLRTRVARVAEDTIDHAGELCRGDEVLAECKSTLACVDHQGHALPLPEYLQVS